MEILNKSISNARKWQGTQMLTTPPTKDVHELSRGKSVPQLPSPSTTMITCHVDAAWDANSGGLHAWVIFLFVWLPMTSPNNVEISHTFPSPSVIFMTD
ncbi:hypothetical protein F2Q68_00043165 [Brassica cretica]|uniref:Uncharacterized protein n=1 Tax=Brassica cretica TaxID=69181 RepID=A0A8S9LID9_BRACR|nr:hypothetical protein F2Q68_00043165 [Brassica cretica]